MTKRLKTKKRSQQIGSPNTTRRGQVPGTLHLDKRVDAILAAAEDDGEGDDQLLPTKRVAAWFQVSEQWLETARTRGTGPEFEIVAPRMIRYRRGACKKFLERRKRLKTSGYRRLREGDAA